jgi:hypothetical protein
VDRPVLRLPLGRPFHHFPSGPYPLLVQGHLGMACFGSTSKPPVLLHVRASSRCQGLRERVHKVEVQACLEGLLQLPTLLDVKGVLAQTADEILAISAEHADRLSRCPSLHSPRLDLPHYQQSQWRPQAHQRVTAEGHWSHKSHMFTSYRHAFHPL